MAKLSLLAGTTSKAVKVFIQDSSKTNGTGLTGLAFGTSGLTCYYIREGAGSTTAVTLQTSTLGTWTTRGFIVVDATNMPGLYELGLPDAAIAAGSKSVVVYLQGAANMAPVLLEIELTAIDNQSTTFGLGTLSVNATQIGGQTASASGTITFPNATLASTINITAGTITTVTNLTNAPTSGDLTATMKTSISGLTIATVTNLTNAPTSGDFTATMKTSLNSSTPASITGAVGSVTGNVGGNVTGSVGSVAGNVSGTVASVVGAVGSVTGNVGGNVTGSVGSVLTGGLIDLTSTTYAEPSSVPAATATLKDKIGWMASLARNKITQTATTQLVRNDSDAGTIGTSTVSDDGTTAIRGKYS